ncbi:alpha/beta fold hydrolase [Streptomyces sp. enrichment culture]|uniref:alpha/beta fold hydrolase n=1 Tax=Streptomyces sp. enrichment culture TaxID=1795815 RepID=UPI003F552A21
MKRIPRATAGLALPVAALVPAVTLTAAAPTMASESSHSAKPTVVLVHGAFADASGWSKVVQSLQAQGYPVIAGANPLRSLSGDSDYLAALLKTIKGPVVLAGHSYGGAVITNAAAGNPNVKSLVYIAGFAPDKGETTLELAAKFPGSRLTDDPQAPVPTALNAVPFGDGPNDVDLYIKPEKFNDVFLSHRVDRDRAAVLAASQRPPGTLTGSEQTKAVAWKSIPSWYLVATDDRTIGTDNLRFMAKRAGSTTVEVDAPHDVMETNSGEVTDLILRAAQDSRPSLAQSGTGERATVLGGVAVVAIAGGAFLVVRSRRA